MTHTTPRWTKGQYKNEDLKSKMSSIESISRVDVELTFDPPWSPEMMTEEGKVKLGL